MNFTNILASVSVGVVDPVDTLPGEWISIPFNLFVESGDVLAVVVSGYTQGGVFPLQPPDVVFWVAGPDGYDEGSAWTRATGGPRSPSRGFSPQPLRTEAFASTPTLCLVCPSQAR